MKLDLTFSRKDNHSCWKEGRSRNNIQGTKELKRVREDKTELQSEEYWHSGSVCRSRANIESYTEVLDGASM